jgi:hypothetical protein
MDTYLKDLSNPPPRRRRKTRTANIGGDNPIIVQSMTNTGNDIAFDTIADVFPVHASPRRCGSPCEHPESKDLQKTQFVKFWDRRQRASVCVVTAKSFYRQINPISIFQFARKSGIALANRRLEMALYASRLGCTNPQA